MATSAGHEDALSVFGQWRMSLVLSVKITWAESLSFKYRSRAKGAGRDPKNNLNGD